MSRQYRTIRTPLYAARIERGLSRAGVAARTGLSEDYVVSLEIGRKTNPSAAVRRAFSAALGVPSHELFPVDAPLQATPEKHMALAA